MIAVKKPIKYPLADIREGHLIDNTNKKAV